MTTSNFPCSLPADDRKEYPLFSGLLAYFPNALAEVSALSKKGNDQHNPGEPMFWARWKSKDHADCLMRHLVDYDKEDTDGVLHATKVAWRALALLQELLERERGYPCPSGAKDTPDEVIESINRLFETGLGPEVLVHDYAPKEEKPAPEAEGTLYNWGDLSIPHWVEWISKEDGDLYGWSHRPAWCDTGDEWKCMGGRVHCWMPWEDADDGSIVDLDGIFPTNSDSLEQRPKSKEVTK